MSNLEHPLETQEVAAVWGLLGPWAVGGWLMQLGGLLFYLLGGTVLVVSTTGAVWLIAGDLRRIFNSGEIWSAFCRMAATK